MKSIESSSKKVLVTGTIAFDHLFSYDSTFLESLRSAVKEETLSVSFLTQNYIKRNGGTGANIAWNLSLLSQPTYLVGDIGPDGKGYAATLKKRGIDTGGVRVLEDQSTPTGVCCTDTRDHQIWFFHRGADAAQDWPDLSVDNSSIFYAIIGARYWPTMAQGVQWCKSKNIPILFDPGQEILKFGEKEFTEAIDASNGMIANEFEWKILSERLNLTPEKLCQKIEFLIVTKSESGHTIYTKEGEKSFPRCDCDDPKDPTGAGDGFRAGLLAGMRSGWPLETASKLGAAIASFVVENEGTLMESLDLKKVYARAKAAYGEELPALNS